MRSHIKYFVKTNQQNFNISAAPSFTLVFTAVFIDGQCYLQSVGARGEAVG